MRKTKEHNNPLYEKYKTPILRAMRKYQEKNPEVMLLNSAKGRAKRCGIEFSLERKDIIIPRYCPLLGCELTNTRGKGRVWTNASLDRINPKIGYIKGNVIVMSDLANRMKQNASEEQLVAFALGVLDHYKGV
jgi:hypothetical protein